MCALFVLAHNYAMLSFTFWNLDMMVNTEHTVRCAVRGMIPLRVTFVMLLGYAYVYLALARVETFFVCLPRVDCYRPTECECANCART